jgi:hypothetical protein
MANSIDFLKQTKSLNTDIVAIGSEQKTVKDKPSLFDSLLSGSKTSSRQTSDNTDVPIQDPKTILTNTDLKADLGKIKDKSSSVNNKEVDNTDLKADINIEDKAGVKEEKVSSTSSLLDRLILEAKKEVKNLDTKANTAQTVSQTLDNEEVVNSDTKVELANSDIKAEIEKLKDKLNSLDNKVVLNTDTKANTAQTVSQTLDNEEVVNSDTKIELANSDIKAEIEKLKDKLNSLDNKVAKNADLTDNVNSKNKTVVKKDVLSSLSSQLDKLVLEAKNETKSINKEELKNLDTKTNTSQIQSQVLDNPEVVSLNTETEAVSSTLVTEARKETKVVNKEELKNSKKDLTQVIKNSNNLTINTDKKINIAVENAPNTVLGLEVSTSKEKELDKAENKIDDKVISFDNKETTNTELNMDKVIVDVKNTSTVNRNNNLNEDIPNSSKITISNTISVPLSDTLDLQDSSTASSKNIQVKSLMDQLIERNTQSIESISPDKVDILQRESASKDFISNIYLSSQKNSINTQNLFNKNEAINLLKDATNIKDVKASAQMLDLGLEDVSVDQTVETQKIVDIPKKLEIDLVAKRNILDNLMLSKNIVDPDIKNLITKSVEASSALLDDTLKVSEDTTVNVNSPISYNIQSKIIGARQQMSTMMSDIARQMYENYKPPVTVFKINLNPLELGSIAILMKNDKNNSLSISMNVSNNSTLDALIDNQNVLKTSLNKTFDESTKFNLDFNSSNENNNQSSNKGNQNNQGNQNKFEQQIDTQSILELKAENKDREEKSIDYM